MKHSDIVKRTLVCCFMPSPLILFVATAFWVVWALFGRTAAMMVLSVQTLLYVVRMIDVAARPDHWNRWYDERPIKEKR